MQTTQPINQQLADIKTQLDAASERAVSVVNGVDFEKLKQRPQLNQWSIAECLVHLNLSSQAEIAAINRVLEETQMKKPAAAGKQFKMDWLGRFLKWTLEPPPMFFSKMKTTDSFQPIEVEPLTDVLPTFLRLQEEIKASVDAADLPLDEIKVASPFDPRFKYNVFSFFHILLAHERRHLWQAEKVREAIKR